MKMKEYMTPEMEVLEIKLQAHLMEASFNNDDDDDGSGLGSDPLPVLPDGDM